MQFLTSNTAEDRRRAVALAVALTTGTPLAPQRYERQLLMLYQQGTLIIEEVVELLELSIYQVLYHSRATALPSAAQLQQLLAQSRSYNAQHQITGLLLYSAGRYVQLLEGPEGNVRSLYARIQGDARHEQVVMLSEGPGPHRCFADWRMGFGQVAALAVDQVVAAVQGTAPAPNAGVDEAYLQVLLHAFRPDL